MLDLSISADDVGLFMQRLRDAAPGATALFDNGVLRVPEEFEEAAQSLFDAGPVLPSKAELGAIAANLRWAKEVGGIEIAGIAVATDDRSKQMIMGARMAAAADTAFTTPWVGSDGTIRDLNATEIIAISDAVLAHVHTCFSLFSTVQASIAGGQFTSRSQVEAAFA